MSTTNVLLIEWGVPIEGRETKALEEFMNQVAWWGELKASGKIASFATFGPVTGNLAERAGFAIIEGTEKQIHDFHTSEEFRVRLNRASIGVHNVRLTLCESGDAMTQRMQRYGRALKDMLG